MSPDNPEQNAELDGVFVDLEVKDMVEKNPPRGEQAAAELGAKFYAMHQAGKAPSASQVAMTFYALIVTHGKAQGDAAIFRAGLDKLRTLVPDNPRAKAWIAQQEKVLAELEAGGK